MQQNRYEKYKNIDWFGYVNSIPEHWEILPNIALFTERVAKRHADEELLSVTINKGVIKQTDNDNKKDISNEDKSNYKYVDIGDIAYNKMRMWQGSVGYSKYSGIVSPAYVVLKPKLSRVANSIYFHYLFRTSFYNMYSRQYSYGLCDDQLNLRFFDFKRMYSIVPPIIEQIKIAEYLNKKQQYLENIVEKKQKTIELLKEKKKAIINKAITKGINPNVKMKNSGIEWLGEVPEHWKVSKVKYISNLKSGNTITSASIDVVGNYPVFGGNGIRGYSKKYTHEGDFVLIGRQGALCGNINYANGKFFATEHAVVCTPRKNYNYLWFGELLRIMNLNQYSESAAQPGLAVENINQLKIPLPELIEQDEIAEFIKSQIENIEFLQKKAEEGIELIKEYFESLVYNVVTGQIKIK